jgi:molybdopterin-binding protein
MRNEFLAKVVLLQILEEDFLPLVRKQRDQFSDVFAALLEDHDQSVIALWRREQVRAVSRFLDECEGSSASYVEPDIGEEMILSARNQLRGAVVSVKHGGVLSSVKVEIAPGQVMTSTVTREAVDQLRLSPGSEITALCKATDVMLAAQGRRGRADR